LGLGAEEQEIAAGSGNAIGSDCVDGEGWLGGWRGKGRTGLTKCLLPWLP